MIHMHYFYALLKNNLYLKLGVGCLCFCSPSELFTGSLHPLYMAIIMKPSEGVVGVERCRAC